MKVQIKRIEITIEPEDPMAEATRLRYSRETDGWVIEGPARPRYLGALAEAARLLIGAEKLD